MNNKKTKTIGKHVLKRLHTELAELFSKYKTIDIHYTEEIIRIKIGNKEIHVNYQYPFHAPKVFIRSYPYYQFLNTSCPKIMQTMQKYSGLHCLCCNTIICHSNWTPMYHIEKILNEIEYMNYIKTIVKYDHAMQYLCNKTAIPQVIGNTIFEYLQGTSPFLITSLQI